MTNGTTLYLVLIEYIALCYRWTHRVILFWFVKPCIIYSLISFHVFRSLSWLLDSQHVSQFWLLNMLNPLQCVKTYNSLKGMFSVGNNLTNPTAEWVSLQSVLFSCGLQECGSHNDGKPTTNKLFFSCMRSPLTSTCVPLLDTHSTNQKAQQGSWNRSLYDRCGWWTHCVKKHTFIVIILILL